MAMSSAVYKSVFKPMREREMKTNERENDEMSTSSFSMEGKTHTHTTTEELLSWNSRSCQDGAQAEKREKKEEKRGEDGTSRNRRQLATRKTIVLFSHLCRDQFFKHRRSRRRAREREDDWKESLPSRRVCSTHVQGITTFGVISIRQSIFSRDTWRRSD